MKSLTLVILALALLAPVSAAQYWTVVGDDIEDVLAGANFAASMKGTLGIEFMGKTLEQARTGLPLASDIVFIAYLDQGDAFLLGPSLFDADARVMETYLDEQGYDVHREDGFDEIIPAQREEVDERPRACPADAKVCWDGSAVGRDPEDCSVFLPCPPEPMPEEITETPPVPVPAPQEAPLPPEKTNVFARTWRWFARLFS